MHVLNASTISILKQSAVGQLDLLAIDTYVMEVCTYRLNIFKV